jgi:hypothetical protein
MFRKVLEVTAFCICNGTIPKRDEVTGDWRKFHIEEFHNLYSSSNIIKQIK